MIVNKTEDKNVAQVTLSTLFVHTTTSYTAQPLLCLRPHREVAQAPQIAVAIVVQKSGCVDSWLSQPATRVIGG